MKLNSVASDVVGLRLRLANAHEAGRREEETMLWNWPSVLPVLARLPRLALCLPAWLMAMLSGWAIQIKINDALTTSGDGDGERWATHRAPEKEKEKGIESGREEDKQPDRTATRGSHKNYFTCGQHVTTMVKLSHLARTHGTRHTAGAEPVPPHSQTAT